MSITMRLCRGEADFPLIADLLRAMPPTTRHLVDFPWRMCSPTLDSGHDARVWEDSDGTLQAFAAWQIYWAAFDYYVRPGPQQSSIEAQLFAVAEQRFQQLDQERGRPLPYWAEYRNDDTERRDVLEQHGFVLDDDFHYVQLSHPLVERLPKPLLPKGFTLRPLAGLQEAEAYVTLHRAAFESTSMTLAWRQRTLRTPQYQPELDLVVAAPDGTLVGFCVGWLDQQRHLGQVEPIGVHPDFQHMGLGRALLVEILRRFKAHHAESVLVETENDRLPALQAYEAVGFRSVHAGIRKGSGLRRENFDIMT